MSSKKANEPALLRFANKQGLGEACAREVIALAREAIDARGRFVVALSGGSQPKILAAGLMAVAGKGDMDPSYSKWHVFFADERYVAPTHKDSNFGACSGALFSQEGVDIPREQIHTVDVEKSLEENVKVYEKAVRNACGGAAAGGGATPVFDLVLLGMGPDGHVASLFPGHKLLEAGKDGAVVASISDSPKPPPQRITLTMPVICAARHAFVVTAGDSKAEAVGAVFGGDTKLPAGRVRGADVRWFVDETAASKL